MHEYHGAAKPSRLPLSPELVRNVPQFRDLVVYRRRVGFTLVALMMIIYVGFFSLVAFAPLSLGSHVAGFGSLGFLLVFLMFVVAWGLTWIYLRQMETRLTPLEDAVRSALLSVVQGVQGVAQ